MHIESEFHNHTLPTATDGRSAGDVAIQCAAVAGDLTRAAYDSSHTVSVKGRGNIATECDLQVERAVAEILLAAFPGDGLLAEETAADTEAKGYVWVVDPIDGTRNFASGIPFFCFNLALTFDGQPVLALTYDPMRDESFYAERGGGLTVNGHAASVSSKSSVAEGVLGLDLGYDDRMGKQQLEFAYHVFPGVQALRIPGSAALGLAYAAAGRFDCFCHPYLFPWDIAAGLLLVSEGGGVITTREGEMATLYERTAVAGGAAVHADFLRIWQAFRAATQATGFVHPADG